MDTEERAALLADCLEDLEDDLGERPASRDRPAIEEAGLVPLLEVVHAVRRVQHPQLSPAAMAAGLAQVQGALAGRRRPTPRPAPWARRLAWAALALLLALLLSTGTAWAAQDSLPGELLYPVKRATEQARLSLTRRPEARSNLLISLAERRLDEVAQLCPEGDCPQDLLDSLAAQTSAAQAEIERIPQGERTQLLEKIVALTERQQDVLTQVLEKAPAPARPGLERALERSQQGKERARQSLEREKTHRSKPDTPPGQEHTPGPPPKEHSPGPPAKARTPGPPDKAHPPGPQKTHRPKPTQKDK